MEEKRIEIFITLGSACRLESTLCDVELPLSRHFTEYEQILELLKAFCYGLEHFPRGIYSHTWN